MKFEKERNRKKIERYLNGPDRLFEKSPRVSQMSLSNLKELEKEIRQKKFDYLHKLDFVMAARLSGFESKIKEEIANKQ